MDSSFLESKRQKYRKSFLSERIRNLGAAAGSAGENNILRESLPPEVEEGNVEYKLKLVDPPPHRLQHLITQMKWRLAEGHGECFYEIGVSDSGRLVGLTNEEMEASIATLRKMGKALLADVSVVRERVVQNNDYHRSNRRRSSKASDHDDKNNTSSSSACTSPSNSTLKVAEVLVRKTVIDQQHFLEIKVILIGGADAGKSTFIGVMTHSDLDNGRGKSRLNALRHRHEIESGRTSSISHQIIGFSQSGELINYATTHVTAWEHICETASKVVSFFDTCGHPKYQHTTIRGLTGQSPDYSCLIVNGGLGYIPDTSKEHMRISLAIKVPVFIIITKIDVATAEELTHTLESLMSFLKSPGITMTPVVIQNEDDVLTSISNFTSLCIAPIFLTSFVTGENIDLLSTFFNVLPKSSSSTSVDQEAEDEETEFQIDDIYTVPHVGTVLGGLMQSGKINIKTFAGRQQTYFLGPDHGRFMPVQIKSIQRQRCSVYVASAGQAVTIALRPVKSAGEGGAGDTSHCSTDDMLLASGEQPIGTRSVTATVTDQQGVSISTTANNTCDQFSDTASVTSTTSYTSSCLLTASGSSSKRTFGDLGGPFLNGGLPPFCFRKGQVLLSAPPSTFPFKFGVWEIDADLRSLTHDVSLSPLMHGVVYCGSVRQSARIVSIQAVVGGDCSGAGKSSSPNSSSSSPTDMMASTASNSLCGSLVASNLHFARVRLKFQTEREWIKVGSTLLFRTEKMKCVGKVVALVS